MTAAWYVILGAFATTYILLGFWLLSLELRLRRHATVLGPITSLMKLAGMVLGQHLPEQPPVEATRSEGRDVSES